MASAGPASPTAGGVDTTIGTVSWTNSSDVAGASDGNAATAPGLSNGKITHYIVATGFGFALPSNATVTAITPAIRRKTSNTGGQVRDYRVRVYDSGSISSSGWEATSTNWPGSYAWKTYGPLMPATLSYSAVNASTFGIAIAAINANGTSASAVVDAVTVTIEYTTSAGVSASVVASTATVHTTIVGSSLGGGRPTSGLGSTSRSTTNVRYVSPAGNDSTGTGTVSAPWRTLDGAAAKSPVDTTIIMRGGTYPSADFTGITGDGQWRVFAPYPGETVTVGYRRFHGSSYIRFEGTPENRIKVSTAGQAPSTQFLRPLYITGSSSYLEFEYEEASGDSCRNHVWVTGGHHLAYENNYLHDNVYIGPADAATNCIVLEPAGPAIRDVWIRFNTLENLQGFDGIHLSSGSTSPTNRYRNIWLFGNSVNGLYKGSSTAHADSMQIIGYSGPLTPRSPTEGPADAQGRPTGDVGVVIDSNRLKRCRGFLIMPDATKNSAGTYVGGPGEHDTVIVRNNLFYEPRAASVSDTPNAGFLIKLNANCPGARIINNTASLYPVGATAAAGDGIVIVYRSPNAASTDYGTTGVILKNNIADFVHVGSGVTFAVRGHNTIRAQTGYTFGPGDITGTVTFNDPTSEDFSLPKVAPNARNNADPAYAPARDFLRNTRDSTPDRGAIEWVDEFEILARRVLAPVTAHTATVGATGLGIRARHVNAVATVYGATVGLPAEETDVEVGGALVIDETLVLFSENSEDTPAAGYVLTGHAFPGPAATRIAASSSETEGDLTAGVHFENRSISLRLDVRGETHAELRTNMRALERRVAKLQRDGGELRWTIPTGQSVIFDIVGVESYTPAFDDQPGLFYSGKVVPVELTLLARPFGRGRRMKLGTWAELTEPQLNFELPVIPGDVPALGELEVTPMSGLSAMTWGLEAAGYDATRYALTNIPTTYMDPLTGSSVANAGVNGVPAYRNQFAGTGTIYDLLEVFSDDGGAPNQHTGAYRVLARVKRTSADPDVAVRLAWLPYWGATSRMVTNAWVTMPSTTWHYVDLGIVETDFEHVSQLGWRGRIQGVSAAADAVVYVERIELIPTERSGWVDSGAAADKFTITHVRAYVTLTDFNNPDATDRVPPQSYEGDYVKLPVDRRARLVVRTFAGEGFDTVNTPTVANVWATPRYLTIPDRVDDDDEDA